MISTAVALQDATGNAIISPDTLVQASFIANNREHMTDEQFASVLFNYSAHIATLTASLVVGVVMSKEDVENLLSTMEELEDMGQAGE